MSDTKLPLLDALIHANHELIYPDWPKPEFEKWGRGRPSKEKKEKRALLHKWRSEIKVKYEPRIKPTN